MDKDIIKYNNLQDWGEENINAFYSFIIKSIDVHFTGIWVVGSRVFSAFNKNSDIDVRVITTARTGEMDLYFEGIRVSLHFRSKTEKNIAYNRFELPYYNLITREMIQGADVKKYLDWRKNGYK